MLSNSETGLLLTGLDGGNPLGFLAAIGTLRVLSDKTAEPVRLGWRFAQGCWRPRIVGCGDKQTELCDKLLQALKKDSTEIFDIGREQQSDRIRNKFPFCVDQFQQNLRATVVNRSDRRDADFLAGFGTEIYPDSKNEFQCTSFKMVRSGDPKGQGMLSYAKAIREQLEYHHLERTLFVAWDYQDKSYNLRWDPIEDQRYALRWQNPSIKNLAFGPGTMIGANCLAFDAFRCLPCVPVGPRAHTTGFKQHGKLRRFVWPIWIPSVDMETARSLLALKAIHESSNNRIRIDALKARGIQEVFGSTVIRQNQYYSNFTPARPILTAPVEQHIN